MTDKKVSVEKMLVFLQHIWDDAEFAVTQEDREMCEAIGAALKRGDELEKKMEEWQQRAAAACIESNENLKVEKAMSLIEDLCDLGKEGT